MERNLVNAEEGQDQQSHHKCRISFHTEWHERVFTSYPLDSLLLLLLSSLADGLRYTDCVNRSIQFNF